MKTKINTTQIIERDEAFRYFERLMRRGTIRLKTTASAEQTVCPTNPTEQAANQTVCPTKQTAQATNQTAYELSEIVGICSTRVSMLLKSSLPFEPYDEDANE